MLRPCTAPSASGSRAASRGRGTSAASAAGGRGPASWTWKLACRLKIARPCWMATTRRVGEAAAVADAVDLVEDRHRRVAGAQEVGVERVHLAARSSTVRVAATSACPATWPPNTRWRFSSGERPRKMLTSIGSRSSEPHEVVEGGRRRDESRVLGRGGDVSRRAGSVRAFRAQPVPTRGTPISAPLARVGRIRYSDAHGSVASMQSATFPTMAARHDPDQLPSATSAASPLHQAGRSDDLIRAVRRRRHAVPVGLEQP